ncbi:hypothetical protein HPB49_012848 [Dermacentor silvarum]|uniref:Uncharacterized protein n=1 Tax=Dermacentor silvarum TaxID=543639 RepID=A0ACB8D5I9_DERSI|nr:hypothetical protein HPB49_012848 [Dermacentor silvarum]
MARQPVYETTLDLRLKQRYADQGLDRMAQSPQPVPTPRGSSSSGGGNPSIPIPATRDHGLAFKQASAAIDQSHPLPRSPISENPLAAPAGAVAVKPIIHAGVKALPTESVRRPRHSAHRNEAPLQNGSDCALQSFRASLSVDSLSNSSCDSLRKPEEKRGRLVAVAPLTLSLLHLGQAIYEAAGIRYDEREADTICPNNFQNIIVVSTLNQDHANKYQCIKTIKFNCKEYEVGAYETDPGRYS